LFDSVMLLFVVSIRCEFSRVPDFPPPRDPGTSGLGLIRW